MRLMSLSPLALSICLASPLIAAGRPRKAEPAASPAVPALPVDATFLKPLKARAIGPAVMGGRISEVAVDPSDPFTCYVGLAHGGVMKTTDAGASFQPIFDKTGVGSIGALAVSPANAKVVWAGTGEANDRNSSGWGKGVFRSTDGGTTWTAAGLEASRCIARLAVHPKDEAVAYAAAMGDLWTPGGERGLYKTTDGGKSWKAVLTAPAPYGDRVGCGDVVLDPRNPDIVYAALYARRRFPWAFQAGPAATEGRDLGGIFRSTDGGATWTKLTKGLPAGTGRIGLAVSASKPGVVMAVVQSDEGGTVPIMDIMSKAGGTFRSEDGGDTWTRTSPLNPRPFYFSQIRIAPDDDRRVYVLGFGLHVSEDGGATWREDRSEKVHPDLHALAFDPKAPKHLLLGTDGGLYQSHSAGASWEALNRFPAGEYYRIAVDDGTPYRVAGGLQDNRNWVGPGRTFSKDGILNQDWTNLGGGDGFHVLFDPADAGILFAESQGGSIFRVNLRSGATKFLRPEPAEGQEAYRFHWASPFLRSRHAKDVLYLAGNRVFKLTDRGERWKPISPDLTTQDPQRTRTSGSGAETFGVIYTLAESPAKAGQLWVGTDDGKVWRTEDEGGTWVDLTPNLPAAVKGRWIQRLEAGREPGVAYLVAQAYRTGSYAPLVYRTADGGRTWQGLGAGLPPDQPAHVVKEDPVNPKVLYCGTEGGLFVSLDQGQRWLPLGDLPPVPVDDLAIQARENDLVIATHGRSLFVLDDLSVLQGLSPEVLGGELHLFTPRPVLARQLLPGNANEEGKAGTFRGVNPPLGATFQIYLKADTGEDLSLAIKAPDGRPVANLKAPGRAGLQRIAWDLRPTSDLVSSYRGEGSKFVKPGLYTVTVTRGSAEAAGTIQMEVGEDLETR
ncbi:sialidase family protein [Geothrix sp. SG200]|uniref:WD40/YVTN/BNR-like repeat-containing protein n=1 Tax=Geothrix sp. SG200 TaxID=2922865 RepID=UPI001FAC5520|nr:sialidase family protein [Geothrix sp. SG200]